MNIVGISAFYHDSAAALLRDGALVAAAQEGRFTRVKHDPRLPIEATKACLKIAGLGLDQIDRVAYYEDPEARRARQRAYGVEPSLDPDPLRAIRERLGFEGPIDVYAHHASHAASAYYFSEFDSAAVMTADGVGEWETTTYGVGRGASLETLHAVRFPDSLGLLYSTITAYLGFAVNSGEAKIMGLAAYGTPRFERHVRALVRLGEGGDFTLDSRCFDFGERMFSPTLVEHLGVPPRVADSPLEQVHMDLAASAQRVLEDVLLDKLKWLQRATGERRVCLAGGVALNCVANGRIVEEGPFDEVFVQPAAGDSGGALGAAALAHVAHTGERPAPLEHLFLGPAYDARPIVAATPVEAVDYEDRTDALIAEVVRRLADGQVIGWFHGRMEFGPRALGGRSILADPRDPGMRERINKHIKRREWFRPFAPAILAGHLEGWVNTDRPSPYMLRAHAVLGHMPAATHVDGTARLQTVDAARAPRFHALLQAWFAHTGCPALLNTSFNVRGRPIVCTPEDALMCAADAGLDAVVLDDLLIDHWPSAWTELVRAWQGPPARALPRDLYTF